MTYTYWWALLVWALSGCSECTHAERRIDLVLLPTYTWYLGQLDAHHIVPPQRPINLIITPLFIGPDSDEMIGLCVDHIIPASWFDLTDERQQMMAFHYSNTQPMWAKDNFSKGNRHT